MGTIDLLKMSRLYYAQITLACVAAMLFVMFALQPTSAPEQVLQTVPCMRPRFQMGGTSRQILRPSATKKNIVPRRKMMQLGGFAAALSLAKASQAAEGFTDSLILEASSTMTL